MAQHSAICSGHDTCEGLSDLGSGALGVASRIRAQFPRPVRQSIHGYAIHKQRVLNYPEVLHGSAVPHGLRDTAAQVGN